MRKLIVSFFYFVAVPFGLTISFICDWVGEFVCTALRCKLEILSALQAGDGGAWMSIECARIFFFGANNEPAYL